MDEKDKSELDKLSKEPGKLNTYLSSLAKSFERLSDAVQAISSAQVEEGKKKPFYRQNDCVDVFNAKDQAGGYDSRQSQGNRDS